VTAPAIERVVRLADGSTARLRPLHSADAEQVRELYDRSSDISRYLRFFSPMTVDGAVRLTRSPADDARHCMLVAEVAGRVVGLGQYDADEHDPAVAEVAFMVEDHEQGLGIGTLLLEALAERAAARGVRRFRASFLRQNERMPDVFAHAGFQVHWGEEDFGVASAEFDLVPDGGWSEAHARRDDHAQARSIARLLRPRSIAVVGAGSRPTSIGRAIVENLVASGFTGAVHAVNTHPTVVAGIESVATVLDVDGPVDLAVVAVPAAGVLDVARQCAQKGVEGVVVVSGGFAELADGAARQAELAATCRESGMRLVGPNCVGVVNTDEAIRMNATFAPVAPVPGRLGLASQSGGVGIALLARAHHLGVGVSTFVSMGNKADVSGNDLMQYWREDESTDVVVLYLESFGNPRKFAHIARVLTREKPVIALKSGRTTAGARGTRSHTAALADPDTAVDALLRQTGVIRVDTLAELFDVAALLSHQPVPGGRRVAVMSNGGGPAIVAADACVAAGLDVPELSADLGAALRALAPAGGTGNPVDLVAAAGPDVFEQATGLLLASGEIDALLVIYVAPYVTHADEIGAAVARAAAHGPRGIPIASCFLGLEHPPSALETPGGGAVPAFAAPESAARALAHAARLGEWRARPRGRVPELATDAASARTRVRAVLESNPERAGDGIWLDPSVATDLLADFGIPVVHTRAVDSADAARAAADEVGYPVALKAVAPGLVHKSDVGGVHLGLADANAVVAAYEQMQQSVTSMTGAVVQPMVAPGVELIVGIQHDASFGPLVVFGLGGWAAELTRDSVVMVPPLTDVDVDELLHSLRGSPLLFGYRNAPPVDQVALAELVARIARLADEVDEIAELDCNPVIASPQGVVVVDVKARVVPRAGPPPPFSLG
jgi:acyl-CoA synthetase (NDP forming)/GNAT superfamily N-acetyltransferase